MPFIIIDRLVNLVESFGSKDSVSHFSPEALIRGIESRISELKEIDKDDYSPTNKYKKNEIRGLIRLSLRALNIKNEEFYDKERDKYYTYLRNG